MTTEAKATKKTPANRPTTVKSRAAKPGERVPLSGIRDIITVRGKNPDFEYRWVKDNDENGNWIFQMHQAGWDFVPSGSVQVGQAAVYRSEDVGSIIRYPSGQNFLFLMQIPKELYDEDQLRKAREIDETERQIFAADEDEGQYGSNKNTFHIGKVGEDENLK